jgi:hypothetical protein
MKKKAIKKSVEINAPKEIVWDVLLEDQYTRIWYAEFSEGTHAETDWKVGSKAIFKDSTNSGLIGRIVINKPYEIVSLEYTGMIYNGVEDYESDIANSLKGGLETYRLSGTDKRTVLSIECDMDDNMIESMSEAWDRALQKMKNLCESQIEYEVR